MSWKSFVAGCWTVPQLVFKHCKAKGVEKRGNKKQRKWRIQEEKERVGRGEKCEEKRNKTEWRQNR